MVAMDIVLQDLAILSLCLVSIVSQHPSKTGNGGMADKAGEVPSSFARVNLIWFAPTTGGMPSGMPALSRDQLYCSPVPHSSRTQLK